MRKTIKVIDLLNKIANGEEIPKKIKVKDYIFIWKVSDNGTGYYNVKEDTGYYWLENYVSLDNSEDLNTEIEIIEEEPEIDIQKLKGIEKTSTTISTDNEVRIAYSLIHDCENKINDLTKAVKQLDKRINGNKNGE